MSYSEHQYYMQLSYSVRKYDNGMSYSVPEYDIPLSYLMTEYDNWMWYFCRNMTLTCFPVGIFLSYLFIILHGRCLGNIRCYMTVTFCFGMFILYSQENTYHVILCVSLWHVNSVKEYGQWQIPWWNSPLSQFGEFRTEFAIGHISFQNFTMS